MEIGISLERKQTDKDNDDDVLFVVEQEARLKAIQHSGRTPTLTELLYNTAEEQIVSIRQFLFGENDADNTGN